MLSKLSVQFSNQDRPKDIKKKGEQFRYNYGQGRYRSDGGDRYSRPSYRGRSQYQQNYGERSQYIQNYRRHFRETLNNRG